MNQIRSGEDITSILKNISVFFFDVDGTLFSSETILEPVYRQAVEIYNQKHATSIPLPSYEQIIPFIGYTVKQIFEGVFPQLEDQQREELSNLVLDIFVERIQNGEGHHYDGVRETIKFLHSKGYKLFTASNGRRAYIEAILKANRIHGYFLEIPAIDNREIHTKGDIIAYILKKYRFSPESCVIVGDRDSDRIAALQNGIYYIAATYGHGKPEEHHQAILKIASIRELMEYFSFTHP